MKIKEYTLEATIGLPEYSNVKPSITLTDVEDFESAHSEATKYLDKVWQEYGKKLPVSIPAGQALFERQAFVGGSIYYDDESHTYTNNKGEVYLSGSVYAEQFKKPFDKYAISEAIAKKFKVDAKDVVEMWELKRDASASFGTAMHKALELYGKYGKLAKAIDKTTNLHDHPVIKKAVEDFYATHSGEAVHEALVVDHDNMRAGQIDYLRITGDKKCVVGDFKTNAVVEPQLDNYAHQLSFYASIMEAGGWEVEGLEIYHWDGSWKDYKLERKEVK